MPTIRQILAPEDRERVYGVKDALKRDRVLATDPLGLNRTQFEQYLTAKAEMLIAEALSGGDHPNEVFRHVKLRLKLLDKQWRREAKRLASTNHAA